MGRPLATAILIISHVLKNLSLNPIRHLELHGEVLDEEEDVWMDDVPVGLAFAVKRSEPLDDTWKQIELVPSLQTDLRVFAWAS